MLKIKEIKKEGKYLTIIIKKPKFKDWASFILENRLDFYKYDTDYSCCEPMATIDGNIQLRFVLRNREDIEPYLK